MIIYLHCLQRHVDVVAFFGKDDIPGRNTFTPKEANLKTDEEIFCSGTIRYYFQPIGVIVAKSEESAQVAAELVHVSYETTNKPPLLTIRDILKANAQEKIVHEKTIYPTHTGWQFLFANCLQRLLRVCCFKVKMFRKSSRDLLTLDGSTISTWRLNIAA